CADPSPHVDSASSPCRRAPSLLRASFSPQGGSSMPIDLKELVAEIAESGRARTPLSRLTFLRQVATEEELAEFFTDLLVKTAEAKHTDQWDDLVQFIEDWEDRTLARVAAAATFPEVGVTPWTPIDKPMSQAR